MEQRLYYGIDLGTTNSAISYGHITSNNKVKTEICKINRYGREGGMEAKETLPSVVYYKQNMKNKEITAMVGDFAKNQYGKKYGSVMKSVKNYIGSSENLQLNDYINDTKPEEVSARILQHLLIGLKERLTLPEVPKDVIITIPASFDSDQRRATLEAAKIAGLNINENILLYEPKAVIYNVANMIANDEIPKSQIDFSEKKNVLVFDLGGGTLDVALYRVHNSEKYNFPIIDEVAVGRYTRIGGDDFDKLIAKRLVEEFFRYNGCDKKDVDIDELSQLMESRAEYIKLELSDKVINAKFSGNVVEDSEEFEISEMDIYKGMEFEAYLTKKEIEDLLSPIMARHLKISDVDRIDKLTSIRDVNNIIYPVLDVLDKAKENGNKPKVDAVILNGGMTKFYMIKDRIEEFFGISPVSVNDPDLAVAKEAAFYQYCLEKAEIAVLQGEKLKAEKTSEKEKTQIKKEAVVLELGSAVVNDNINLGLDRGYIRTLVKAGTRLPTGDLEIEKDFKLPVETDNIELPIYIGRGKTTDLPNRKLASRIIKLQKSYSPGTPVSLVVNVDKNKVMTIRAFVGEDSKEEISVEIDTGNSVLNNKKSSKMSTDDVEKLNTATEMERIKINTDIIENLKRNNKGLANLRPDQKRKHKNAKYKINETVNSIKNCGNKGDFEKPLLEVLKTLENSAMLKGILIDIGISVYPFMTQAGKNEFKNICKNIVNEVYMLNNNNKDNITKGIIAIGNIGDKRCAGHLERFIGKSCANNYIVNIVRALGNLSPDNDLILDNFLFYPEDSFNIGAYVYAVGKSFGRGNSKRTDREIEKVAEKLLNIIRKEGPNKDMAVVALGEICNSFAEIEFRLSEKFTERIGTQLAEYVKTVGDENYGDKVRLVTYVILGLNLTEEQSAQWKNLTKKK